MPFYLFRLGKFYPTLLILDLLILQKAWKLFLPVFSQCYMFNIPALLTGSNHDCNKPILRINWQIDQVEVVYRDSDIIFKQIWYYVLRPGSGSLCQTVPDPQCLWLATPDLPVRSSGRLFTWIFIRSLYPMIPPNCFHSDHHLSFHWYLQWSEGLSTDQTQPYHCAGHVLPLRFHGKRRLPVPFYLAWSRRLLLINHLQTCPVLQKHVYHFQWFSTSSERFFKLYRQIKSITHCIPSTRPGSSPVQLQQFSVGWLRLQAAGCPFWCLANRPACWRQLLFTQTYKHVLKTLPKWLPMAWDTPKSWANIPVCLCHHLWACLSPFVFTEMCFHLWLKATSPGN